MRNFSESAALFCALRFDTLIICPSLPASLEETFAKLPNGTSVSS